jgi:transcriptional regulator with XRE-family HTH domain
MKNLGNRIKKMREQSGLHLKDLASKVGISPSALSQIENSKVYPSILTLKAISQSLDTTVGQLIGENEPQALGPVFARAGSLQLAAEDAGGAKCYKIFKPGRFSKLSAISINIPQASRIGAIADLIEAGAFAYLAAGRLAIQVGNETIELDTGDSFIPSKCSSLNFESLSDTAQLILVNPEKQP